MTSLSTLLAEIETSSEKIKALEAELAAERENGKTLVAQYRAQSADALKVLGIAETKERKPRTAQAILVSAARRSIRISVKGGEKNPKTILASALDAADKTAKKKLNLTEVPAEIKAKIEERVKNLPKK
jgi:imidazole glycerol phosphate synthase subunit HisF